MIIDTHAHYDDKQYDTDREFVLNDNLENGIELIINIGCGIESSKQTVALTQKYASIYGIIGFHPDGSEQITEEEFQELETMLSNPKIVAVGEIGLDYYWDKEHHEIQKDWFRRQIRLAKKYKKPICVHSRDAAQDTKDILEEMNASEVGGVIHCFSYGIDMAKEFVKMGFYLGIGGVITFKNGKK